MNSMLDISERKKGVKDDSKVFGLHKAGKSGTI